MGGHEGAKRVRINSSTVGMESAGSYRSASITYRRFTIRDYKEGLTGGSGTLNTAAGAEQENTGNAKDAENSKAQSSATLQDWQSRLQTTSSNVAVRSSSSQTFANIRQTTVRYIFDLLFSARRNRWNQFLQNQGLQASDSQSGFLGGSEQQNNTAAESKIFASNMKVLTYTSETLQFEAEEVSFSTVGTVRTADGREIHFNVNVGMSREFQQHFQQDLQMASFTMCDPLVINLDTDVAGLSDQTFYFDIDADGELDEVSQLAAGSGYLALDKNGDGTINDGSELFGTSSGNGFADLAKYDEDGNGWIDENDAIWDKLKIWCKDENGNDVLYRLADKGVGAICLQNASTDFTLKSAGGQTKGAVRNSGVFLYENGNVGTIQLVDVAKYYDQA